MRARHVLLLLATGGSMACAACGSSGSKGSSGSAALAPAPGGPASASSAAPVLVPALAPTPAPPAASASGAASSAGTGAPPPAAPLSEAEELADVKAANTFTTKLFARVRRTPGNMMLSGTSVRQALGVTALGARGETAREMTSALEMPSDSARAIARGRAELVAWQEARGKADLVVASRVWTDRSFTVKSDFTAAAGSAFGAGAEPVDFGNAPDVARRTINTWVADKTADKIKELLAEGAVDKRSRVVVTNAVYFKARWAAPFAESNTKNEPFRTNGKTADVPTMHATGSRAFARIAGAKLLGLRYEGSQLGMLVVLPDDAAGLAKLEESVSPDAFETWAKALTAQRVAVSLPRFGFQWGGPLDAPLQELGMRSAFSNKADLGGMAEGGSASEKLQISRVVQKTWVAVDETGTEAAAASGVVMSVTSAQTGPVAEFKADHPFLFFVYDTKLARILFAGRVVEPKG